MEWLIIFLLCGAAAYQYNQSQEAKRRMERLEDRLNHYLRYSAAPQNGEAQAKAASFPGETLSETPGDAGEPAAPPPPTAVTIRQSQAAQETAPPLAPEVPEPKRESEPEPELQQPAQIEQPVSKGFSFDFEDIVGRRLPIWVGGITLAVAGVLMVRYSIEAGLMTPQVRVILSFLFGIGLLVGAEVAYRFEDRVADERVRQALAGAGLATLYAGFYLAGTQYGLIGQTVAFLGLALVTALAIGLSYRFGLPSAVLGLVGGFAAPALVGGDDANLPLLSLYLGLVTAGLTYTGNRQRRPWLGMAALIGGLGWGAMLLLAGDFGTIELLSLGLYFIVLGAVLPAMLSTERFEQPLRLISAGLSSLQLAVLVAEGGFSMLGWGLYLLLGAALAWFGWRKPTMRAASAMAATVGVLLLLQWFDLPAASFAGVVAALAALFAAVPLAHIFRRDEHRVDMALTAAVPLALGLVALFTFGTFDRDVVRLPEALALLALAALPLVAAWRMWPRTGGWALATNLGSGAVLIVLATACLLPTPAVPIAAAAVSLALIWLLRARMEGDMPLSVLAVGAAVLTTILVPTTIATFGELNVLWHGSSDPDAYSFIRWLSAFAPWVALAWFDRRSAPRSVAEFIAGLLLFAALSQLLPPIALVWTAAALILALRWRMPERGMAMMGLLLPIAAWVVLPLGEWLGGALLSLGGEPLLLTALPSLRETLGFILPFAVGLAAARLSVADRTVPLWPAAIAVAIVVVHVLYRQIFGIDSLVAFHERGLAERTVWEALLLALAWLFAKGTGPLAPSRTVAIALAATALAHFTLFTGLLHNPLWAEQAVGPLPIVNLVLAAYGVALAALLSLRIWLPRLRRGIDSTVMALALMAAITLLRQMFAGTYPAAVPLGQTEDLLRSLIGIVLALVFLLIGSRRDERTWRVGSLVLMTVTVFKVFLLDTAGLEGLVRIASFVALGASLIGIGWFYSRQLRSAPAEEQAAGS